MDLAEQLLETYTLNELLERSDVTETEIVELLLKWGWIRLEDLPLGVDTQIER